MLQQADNAAAMLPEVKSLYVHLHYSPPFISPGWEVLMFKVLEQIDGNWGERDSPAVFCREATSDGGERLRVSLPREEAFLLFKLVEALRPPFQLLYVLHTPRGEGEAGRYQSPPLSRTQTQDFLRRFETFFLADARYDLWVRSASSDDVIVWDRHNDL